MNSPAEHFRKFEKDVAAELASHSPTRWLSISISFAQAEMVHRGATSEQLSGVRQFLDILMGMGFEQTEMKRLPQKQLETFDNPFPNVDPNDTKKPAE